MTEIKPFPIYSHLTSHSSNCPSNNIELSSPVDREMCNFLGKLNQSSSLGLTGSELVSLAKGSFVPSPSNFRVQGTARKPSPKLLGADQSGINSPSCVGLNTIVQGTGGPHCHQGPPPQAFKSSGKERVTTTTTERTFRLNTFSTAVGPKSQRGGKNPKSLACINHESFAHSDSTGPTTRSKSKSSGAGHRSKSQSSSEASFQCRVIKLTQREHMILERYEKLTKSIEKLNKVSAAKKKNLQLFLLSRPQEVHVSGKDFEYARINLLSFIRLSQVWWDKRRAKGATNKSASKLKQCPYNLRGRMQKKTTCFLSNLPSSRRGPKPGDIGPIIPTRTRSAVQVISKQTNAAKPRPVFLPPPLPKIIDEPLPPSQIIKASPPANVIKPPPLPKVTQPPPKISPQNRPPPSTPQNTWIPKRAVPLVSKPTPPKQSGMSRAEKRKRLASHPNSGKSQPNPNHPRSWAWHPRMTPRVWQTNNNNNFPPRPRNPTWMGPPMMPFGHAPNFLNWSSYCPWQVQGLPNPWQAQGPPNPWQPQQQYPPFPPSRSRGVNNGYGLWDRGGGNNAPYLQNNNAFWQ